MLAAIGSHSDYTDELKTIITCIMFNHSLHCKLINS